MKPSTSLPYVNIIQSGRTKCIKIKNPCIPQGTEVVITLHDWGFTLERADITTTKKTRYASKATCGWCSIHVADIPIKVGKFDIDQEESTEDILYIYY